MIGRLQAQLSLLAAQDSYLMANTVFVPAQDPGKVLRHILSLEPMNQISRGLIRAGSARILMRFILLEFQTLVHLQKQRDGSYPSYPLAPEKKGLSYEQLYSEVIRIEKLIDDTDSNILKQMIEYREYMWT